MSCDMCGSEGITYLALVEGTELNVCKKCSSFGKIIKKRVPKKVKKIKTPAQDNEIIQVVREDYPAIIRGKREKLKLKHFTGLVKFAVHWSNKIMQ